MTCNGGKVCGGATGARVSECAAAEADAEDTPAALAVRNEAEGAPGCRGGGPDGILVPGWRGRGWGGGGGAGSGRGWGKSATTRRTERQGSVSYIRGGR